MRVLIRLIIIGFLITAAFSNEEVVQFHVQHQIQGDSVYIETSASDVTFQTSKEEKTQAAIDIYINGEWVDRAEQAAFKVDELSAGYHEISLQLMNDDEKALSSVETFTVKIE
ncbi:hypothetical protein B0H94_10290 [Salsuginibacillus halophilus]|uniref:Uncharacterized protein n=1 Tax=Salsuginibacillus halophilus TaxID=517424 RepID=A0A2P8HXA0_9BACI|nr:hypothetical protein [Salsuginibacillus halophilus]PSL50814.1 hypothetical protein B0H94_10290 [Salsuginibacillus halophilus]